jgi:hypothetical protein
MNPDPWKHTPGAGRPSTIVKKAGIFRTWHAIIIFFTHVIIYVQKF